MQLFSLVSFTSSPAFPSARVEGIIARSGPSLQLTYRLFSNPQSLRIPAPAAIPERRPKLWEETCFELFLAAKGAPGYWEFNLSPAGHWNVYRFAGYRQAMAEEPAFAALPFTVTAETGGLSLGLEIDLNKILPAASMLEAGASAVLRSADGTASYWALAHPGPAPDFHRREGFLLSLA